MQPTDLEDRTPPLTPGESPAPHQHEHDDEHDHDHGLKRADLVRIGLVGLAVIASWFELWRPVASFDFISLAAVLLGGWPIFHEAWEAVRARRMTMELSMTIALAAAVAIGEFFTAAVIVLFVLVAELLEGLTVGRGRKAIKDLLDLLPHRVTVRRSGGTEEAEAAELRAGDVVIVKPGMRLPVDGAVLRGHSFVDQAAVTGESLPVEKVPGTQVYAGTINQSGVLEVTATGVGRDTAFGKIIEAVERAEHSRAPVQKLADRLAGYLVYFALACALLTFLIGVSLGVPLWLSLRSTISVIIVAGACGIAAGTPLAILGAIGRAARQGAIVKGGLHLETLGHIDTVVLDETGTLTLGNPEVTAVRPRDGVRAEDVVAVAALGERASEHPLARAVLARAAAMSLSVGDPDDFHYYPGRGLVCRADGETILVGSRAFLTEQGVALDGLAPASDHLSEICVARSARLLGALDVADTLRPEAVDAVRQLRQMGLRTILLTGDAAAIAEAIGRQLGVDEVVGDLLPQDKVTRIEKLLSAGRVVAMVGDGINDAPALTRASVGIAMGSGTDVARESADVVLLGNDLLKLVETLRTARQCRSIIWQNFAGTLIVDGIGVGLAAFGLLNPLLAAFIHVTSELAFILNSTRLLPSPFPRRAP